MLSAGVGMSSSPSTRQTSSQILAAPRCLRVPYWGDCPSQFELIHQVKGIEWDLPSKLFKILSWIDGLGCVLIEPSTLNFNPYPFSIFLNVSVLVLHPCWRSSIQSKVRLELVNFSLCAVSLCSWDVTSSVGSEIKTERESRHSYPCLFEGGEGWCTSCCKVHAMSDWWWVNGRFVYQHAFHIWGVFVTQVYLGFNWTFLPMTPSISNKLRVP